MKKNIIAENIGTFNNNAELFKKIVELNNEIQENNEYIKEEMDHADEEEYYELEDSLEYIDEEDIIEYLDDLDDEDILTFENGNDFIAVSLKEEMLLTTDSEDNYNYMSLEEFCEQFHGWYDEDYIEYLGENFGEEVIKKYTDKYLA